MTFVLGLLACIALWWVSKNATRLNPALTAKLMRRLGTWVVIGIAGLCLLRGRWDLALVFGLAGAWLMEGPENLARRLRGLFAWRPGGGRRFRSDYVEVTLRADGRIGDGVILRGPDAGTRLAAASTETIRRLHDLCRAQDPDGLRLLEAYLDGRNSGRREDAQGDSHPRPSGPANPGALTEEEAHQILGLQRGATPEEVRAAHRTLMKRSHPDQGGSAELAARVNAARDRLTNRHR